jgi:RNA polymerase sigma-70 factor (ECF subfamily)
METAVRHAVRNGDEPAESAGALVERARDGDDVAFEELLARRLAGLLRLASAILGDAEDGRDAVQQACIQAWRELPTLRDPGRFDAWLGRIVTNACRMSMRSRSRRRVREIAVASLDDVSGVTLAARTSPGPGEASDLEVLNAAFERLDPDARILLTLHHLEGRPIAECAALAGITLTTAKWRLHVARSALAKALGSETR